MDTTDAHLQRIATIAGISLSDDIRRESCHVILDGRRFHYLAWGRSSNRPILFLHGGNQSAHTWDVVCAALSDRFFCVALDQRGHGDSEWSYEGDYSPESQARDIALLVEHLGWDRFILVGMSMGCLNGLRYAGANGGSLAGFVAVDAGPWVDLQGASRIRSFVTENVTHDSLEDFVEAAKAFNPARRPELLRHSLTHVVRQRADGRWTWKADRRDPLRFEDMRRWLESLEPLVRRIQCPVLVVRGENSDVFSERDARRFAAALPDGRWVTVPDAGHTIQGDNPRGLLGELRPAMERML